MCRQICASSGMIFPSHFCSSTIMNKTEKAISGPFLFFGNLPYSY